MVPSCDRKTWEFGNAPVPWGLPKDPVDVTIAAKRQNSMLPRPLRMSPVKILIRSKRSMRVCQSCVLLKFHISGISTVLKASC